MYSVLSFGFVSLLNIIDRKFPNILHLMLHLTHNTTPNKEKVDLSPVSQITGWHPVFSGG